MCEAILSLPQDLKTVLRVLEDPDLEDEHRVLIAGALLHVLSSSNAIPGMRGTLAYVDDVIVLRLALERLQNEAPELMGQQADDSPELFEPLGEQLNAIRAYLGELLVVLDRAVDGLPKLSHQGRSAKQCAEDPDTGAWLYDAVQEAIISGLEFDEDEVVRALRGIEQIKRPLEQRVGS